MTPGVVCSSSSSPGPVLYTSPDKSIFPVCVETSKPEIRFNPGAGDQVQSKQGSSVEEGVRSKV